MQSLAAFGDHAPYHAGREAKAKDSILTLDACVAQTSYMLPNLFLFLPGQTGHICQPPLPLGGVMYSCTE